MRFLFCLIRNKLCYKTHDHRYSFYRYSHKKCIFFWQMLVYITFFIRIITDIKFCKEWAFEIVPHSFPYEHTFLIKFNVFHFPFIEN